MRPERELVELAASAMPVHAFRREALGRMMREVGADYAIAWRVDDREPSTPTIVGFSADYWGHFVAQQDRFARELEPLFRRCVAEGAVSDVDAFTSSTRSRLAFHADIVRPIGSRSYLTGALAVGGNPVGFVQLGRSSSVMTARDAARLRALLPAVALGEAVRDARRARAPTHACLTPREREVVDYAVLGYRNAEIARALGTSANTVRNQLARVFSKLDVTTRAELVGLVCSDRVGP